MKLTRAFYAREADRVARDLLGKILVSKTTSDVKKARIVETEAYLGPHDLACHSSKGITKRTKVLFGPPARTYVYLVYGMHNLLNVVTGDHNGQAVLIRAVEPLLNINGKTDGPGKLTKAMGISREQNNLSLLGDLIYINDAPGVKNPTISSRIGVAYAGDWKDAALRFYDTESKYVSKR